MRKILVNYNGKAIFKNTRNTEQSKGTTIRYDRSRSLEFILLENFGENQQTISTLEQLTEIAEQARTRLSQLSTLHLRIAEAQPVISSDLLKSINEAMKNIQNRIPALERSLEEIKLDWRLK